MSTHPFEDFPTNDQADAGNYQEYVARLAVEIRARQEAKTIVAAQGSKVAALPAMSNLTARLAAPRVDEQWRIRGLWPTGGRVNLAAVYKAGKTTLVGNLVRAVLDGTPFLGEFDVEAIPERDGPSIVVFDFEMTENQLLDWYESIGIEHTDGAEILPLRGNAGAFDFLTPAVREQLVERYAGAHTYVLDPAGPVLAALGLDENSNTDVQRFLSTWDQFVMELGGRESFVTIHAGHNGDRARGASAFLGSGDAIWTMTRQGDNAEDPRFLKAIGRGVDLPERSLELDKTTNRLFLGHTSRAEVKQNQDAEKAFPFVLAALEKYGPGTQDDLWDKVRKFHHKDTNDHWEITRAPFRNALPLMAQRGQIEKIPLVPRGVRYKLPPGQRGLAD